LWYGSILFQEGRQGHAENYHVLEGGDANTNIEPGKEADGDWQGNGSSQSQGGGPLQAGTGSNGSTEQAHLNQSLSNIAENPNRVS